MIRKFHILKLAAFIERITLNILHAFRNIDLLKRLASVKSIGTDRSQSAWQRYIGQFSTVIKSITFNRLDSIRNHDKFQFFAMIECIKSDFRNTRRNIDLL